MCERFRGLRVFQAVQGRLKGFQRVTRGFRNFRYVWGGSTEVFIEISRRIRLFQKRFRKFQGRFNGFQVNLRMFHMTWRGENDKRALGAFHVVLGAFQRISRNAKKRYGVQRVIWDVSGGYKEIFKYPADKFITSTRATYGDICTMPSF